MGLHASRFVLVAIVVAAALAASPPADAAPSWGPPAVVGPASTEMGELDIAVAPGGEAIAAWVGSKPERVVAASKRPGRGWSPPVTISGIGEEVEGPHVAVSARKAVIVWGDTIRTRSGSAMVVLASTRLRGKRWSRPRNISAEPRWREEPMAREPQVAMTPSGKTFAVWQAVNEKHLTVSFLASAIQPAASADWSPPAGIRGSYEAEVPQIALSPEGEAVVIWAATYNEESGTSVASRPPDGPWGGARLLGNPGPFPEPQIAMSTRGEPVGAWAETPEGGAESKVKVTTRTPAGKWKVKTLVPEGYGIGPRIVTEPGGRVSVLWNQWESFTEQTIFGSRHFPGGTWSEPRSATAEGLRLYGVAGTPIAVTRDGEAIALWVEDGPLGDLTTILSASRRRPQPWTEPTQVDASATRQIWGTPQLALAADGTAFAAWLCFDGKRWVVKAASRPRGR